MSSRQWFLSPAGAFLFLLLAWQDGNAGIIVNETFSDGDRTNGSDALDVPWFALSMPTPPSSPASLSVNVAPDPVLGTGNALSVDIPSFSNTGSRPTHCVLATFGPVSLGVCVGDSLTLRFDFRLLANTSRPDPAGFRFGIWNSAGTSVTNDDFASDYVITDDDFGYLLTVGTGGANGYEILREPAGYGSILGGPGSVLLFRDASNEAPSINDTEKHTAAFTLERLSASSVRLSLAVAGKTGSAVDSSSSLVDTFDEIAMCGEMSDLDFAIDNIVIETNCVPEPSSLVLLSGLGVMGLCMVWRRKRKGKYPLPVSVP